MTFKYPMAGDVAAELTTHLKVNPTENPWEVHSSSGLEGTFADRADAEHLADELKRGGTTGVRVKAKDKLRPVRLPGAPPMYHTPQGRPPGVPNPHRKNPKLEDVRVSGRILRGWSPSEGTFEVAADMYGQGDEEGAAEVLRNDLGHFAIAIIYMGMARALWVTSYADWVENRIEETDHDEEGAERLRDLQPGPGGDWNDVTPETPKSADQAAEDLTVLIERANNASTGDVPTTLMDLYYRAVEADAEVAKAPFVPDEKYAEMFGHYLAMQALGHGVTWFDDHAKFPIRIPSFEAHAFDSDDLSWSPHVIRREDPGVRKAPRGARRAARKITASKKQNPSSSQPRLWRVWITAYPDSYSDVEASSASQAMNMGALEQKAAHHGEVVEINARPVGEPTGATHSHHVRLGRGGRMEIVR